MIFVVIWFIMLLIRFSVWCVFLICSLYKMMVMLKLISVKRNVIFWKKWMCCVFFCVLCLSFMVRVFISVSSVRFFCCVILLVCWSNSILNFCFINWWIFCFNGVYLCNVWLIIFCVVLLVSGVIFIMLDFVENVCLFWWKVFNVYLKWLKVLFSFFRYLR